MLAMKVAHPFACRHHADSIASFQQLLEVAADDHDPLPSLGERIEQTIDSPTCRDVDAACWFVEEEHFGVADEPFRYRNLLLIATTEGFNPLFDMVAFGFQAGNDLFGDIAFEPLAKDPTQRETIARASRARYSPAPTDGAASRSVCDPR